MKPCYELCETELRGKVLVATEDILPGQEIFREKPLLHFEADHLNPFLDSGHSENESKLLGYFSAFNLLSDHDQSKYLELFGPTNGQAQKLLWEGAKHIRKYDFDTDAYIAAVKEERNLFVRVCSIAKFNGFGDGRSQSVHYTLTRMSHSCMPNCYHERLPGGRNHVVIVRAIVAVKKGEELTIEYNVQHRMKHTHQRRQNYLTFKEFTCHCPRCDALGDDTRQFNCCDETCSGQHLVCQPINQNRLSDPNNPDISALSDLQYGMPFTEPYLLPCNECAKSPTAEYQTEMFALEARLPEICAQMESDFKLFEAVRMAGRVTPPSEVIHLLAHYDSLQLPLLHSLAKPVLSRTLLLISHYLPKSRETELLRLHACRNMIAYYEAIAPFPNLTTAFMYVDTVRSLIYFSSTDLLVFAKECLEKGLKMELLLRGRETRSENAVTAARALVIVLQKLHIFKGEVGCCALCAESTGCAAVSLHLCSRCKNVQYCSGKCQKAHWIIHKMHCFV